MAYLAFSMIARRPRSIQMQVIPRLRILRRGLNETSEV